MVKGSASWKRGRGDTGEDANLERIACNESIQAGQSKTFNSPVDLLVVCFRARLADPDGISAKAAIDGCVHIGILRDDNAKWVREVRFRQVKVKNQHEEKTLLIFTPIEENKHE